LTGPQSSTQGQRTSPSFIFTKILSEVLIYKKRCKKNTMGPRPYGTSLYAKFSFMKRKKNSTNNIPGTTLIEIGLSLYGSEKSI